jgi:hypothetical protein
MSHALKHTARLPVQNVRIEKPIRDLPDSQAQAQTRPGGTPEQKQVAPTLPVSDLRGMAHDEAAHDNELMFTREVLCAMIKQAVKDAKNDREYVTADNKSNRENNQRSAILFLNSEFYKDLCTALGRASGIGIPADKITLEALK